MSTSKRKITQDELRRLMNEQKKKLLNNVNKIDSPLARYDKDGTLHCVICETVVRSETVWKVHINSKNHKQNILSKGKKKEESLKVNNDLITPIKFKKPEAPLVPPPSKKIKGILKNSLNPKIVEKANQAKVFPLKSKLLCVGDDDEDNSEDPDSFSDNKSNKDKNSLGVGSDQIEKEDLNQDVLPEGFFDDPKLDAKIRNVEYKDPIEEEWEQFQKEIKEETNKAQQIIAEDQEESTAERQISEIDEQIRNWSRVVTLEKQKEKVSTIIGGQKMDYNQENTSGDEEEFEEFLDWRSKKSFDYKFKKKLPV